MTQAYRPVRSFDIALVASGGSPNTGALAAHEDVIRLACTTNCRVTLGAAASILLIADTPETFYVRHLTSLSCISQSATTGTLNVSVLTR